MRLPFSLKLLLLTFVALSLVYDQATPTFEASDEVWHYAVVREIADGRGLPVWEEGEHTTFRQEGGQPPVYYLVSALLSNWVDDSDFPQRFVYNPFAHAGVPGTDSNVNLMEHSSLEQFPWRGTTLAVRIIRWMSIVMGAITVLLTYVLASQLFPNNAPLALLAAGFTAFNPTFLFISASVNNDNGVWLLSSLVICVIAFAARIESRVDAPISPSIIELVVNPRVLPWVLGVLLGLAMLTKLSGLVLLPCVYGLLAWRSWARGSVREFLVSACIVTGILAIITGWWFWRNHMLYGEILATRMMTALGAVRAGTPSMIDLVREARGWWISLWGVFGAFNILSGKWTYTFYTALTLVAFVGLIVWAWRALRSRALHISAPQGFALLFLCLSMMGAAYWTRSIYASQGRLVFGAIAPISSFISAGILGLSGWRWHISVSRFLCVGLFIVGLVIPIAYVAPRYTPLEPLVENEMPDDLISVHARFNEEFELYGYTVDRRPRHPGESISVTLYWLALTQMEADYNLALNLHGKNHDHIGKLDTWPGGGLLPTSNWEPNEIYPDRYTLPMDKGSAFPTVLRLDVSFWENELDSRLPITVDEGTSIPSLILDVGRLIEIEPLVISPYYRDGSVLEGGIVLMGYDIPESATKGKSIPVTLYWYTSSPISSDYTVFVHMLNQSDKIVSQADGAPANGDWPTSSWHPGHPVIDIHTLIVPEDLQAGEYSLAIGLYNPQNSTRLSAFTSSGDEWRNSAILTRHMIVMP